MEQRKSHIDSAVGALGTAGGAILLLASWLLDVGNWRLPGPGAWPFLLSLGLIVLGGWFLFRPDPTAPRVAPFEPRWGRLTIALASLFGYVAILGVLGYLVTTTLLLFVQLRWVESRGFGSSLLTALLGAGLSFLVFGWWLKVPLPAGIIPLRVG